MGAQLNLWNHEAHKLAMRRSWFAEIQCKEGKESVLSLNIAIINDIIYICPTIVDETRQDRTLKG